MTTRIMTVLALSSALALTVGCGGGKKGGEEAKDGKLQYAPQINEVEVITLEKRDFARQLLSNGKLTAARKAELDLSDFLAGQGYAIGDTASVPKELMAAAKMKSGYTSALNSLKKARYDISGTILKAPFHGRAADIKARCGDRSPSGTFCTILDDRTMDVEFTVMESEYSFITIGLPVKVRPFAEQTKTYSGKVTNINPSVDSKGQISVRAQVINDGTLIDGMNVKVIVERLIPGQLVVPRSAVVIRDNMDVLFTCTDDGKAHWTYVTILYSNGDSYVVEANKDRDAELNEGDKIIVSGNLNLADNSDATIIE